jgi:hypothetical protein
LHLRIFLLLFPFPFPPGKSVLFKPRFSGSSGVPTIYIYMSARTTEVYTRGLCDLLLYASAEPQSASTIQVEQ